MMQHTFMNRDCRGREPLGKVGDHNLAVTRMCVRKGSKLFQRLGEECAETSQRGAMEDRRGEGGGGEVRVMCVCVCGRVGGEASV